MTIPNTMYRVSRKEKKHYNTCSNNNCIEQPAKQYTQWSGDKQDEPGAQPPTSKCSLRIFGVEKTKVCGT